MLSIWSLPKFCLFVKELNVIDLSGVLMTLRKNIVENTAGGENPGNQHFLPFPQYFLPYPKIN